mgnify:CR=1 FL=1
MDYQIERQIELEREMLQQTVQRYHNNEAKAKEAGRGSDTGAARNLFSKFLKDTSEMLEVYCAARRRKTGMGVKYLNLVQRVDSEFAVAVGFNELFDNVLMSRDSIRGLQDACVKIGQRIEDEVKFARFRKQEPEYFDTVIKDFKSRGTTQYRHIHRVLTMKMREFEVSWEDWTPLERARVGDIVTKVIVESTPLFKIKKAIRRGPKSPPTTLMLTDEALDFIKRHDNFAEALRPMGGPTIVPPKDWENLNHGGFYSPEMQNRFPFVRTRTQKHIQDGDFSRHMQAANKMQATPWCINSQTLHYLKWAVANDFTHLLKKYPKAQPYDFPESPIVNMDKGDLTPQQETDFLHWKRETAQLHTEERKRFADVLSIHRVMTMADRYREFSQFFYVYTCDFRGRFYPVSSGLTTIGADYSKGLLKFARGKRLGEDGLFWFKVHGANLTGYDKATYEERAEYVQAPEFVKQVQEIAANPCTLSATKFIGAADKPLQFLAWVLEYNEVLSQGEDFVSHLSVGLDGSCNGLQNFSAILRDSVGGRATNVLPGEKPNDIYRDVADVAERTLKAEGSNTAKKLLSLPLTRATTKRSVMTLPYGLTKRSSADYVGDWLRKEHSTKYVAYADYFAAQMLLNDHVWSGIGEVVKAAREGMDWLQDVARITGKLEQGLIWTSPSGFKVYQHPKKTRTQRVPSTLEDVTEMRIRVPTDKTDRNSLRNGSAPNYVHSCDASHLALTILESVGIDDWLVVHDDYGCHACDIPELHRAIRVAFVSMYHEVDRLKMFADEIESYTGVTLPERPKMGDMDVREVLNSEYFFG